jgi:S1-C subfamily serine protease
VIVQVGEQPIRDRNDLFRELSRADAGENIRLLVQRRRNDFGNPSLVKLTAEVSKKLVQSSRPSYAIHGSRSWRGLRVEYSTAIAAELLQAGIWRSARNTTRLSISGVEPNSPAWNAGLRPGNGVRSVAGEPIDEPDDFYEAVVAMEGPVILEIIPPNGLTRKVAVPVERQFD